MFAPDEHYEIPTDSAKYINDIAPQLQQLAGYAPYDTTPTDIGYHIHKEDVLPAFREAYYSEAVNREI
jgi:hypothetical protein